MKRFLFLLIVTGGFVFAVQPAARAQEALNHVEIGIFGDYFRLGATQGAALAGTGATALGGAGARLSVNVRRRWQIEAESNYDFAESFSEGFTGPGGTVEGFNTSTVRVLHGLAGPKFQTGQRPGTPVSDGEGRCGRFHVLFGASYLQHLYAAPSPVSALARSMAFFIPAAESRRFSVRLAYDSTWVTKFTLRAALTTICESRLGRRFDSRNCVRRLPAVVTGGNAATAGSLLLRCFDRFNMHGLRRLVVCAGNADALAGKFDRAFPDRLAGRRSGSLDRLERTIPGILRIAVCSPWRFWLRFVSSPSHETRLWRSGCP